MAKVEIELTWKFWVKAALFVVWVLVLGVLAYVAWGMYAIDGVARAGNVFLATLLVLLVLGVLGFWWRLLRRGIGALVPAKA